VYGDLRAIEATWRVIENDDLRPWHIPASETDDSTNADNRTLVERSTHEARLCEIVDQFVEQGKDIWETHHEWVLGTNLANRDAAGFVEIDRSEPYGIREFSSDLESVKTRLGRDDYRIVLPTDAPSPLSPEESISELSVSEWKVDDSPETEDASDVTRFDGGFTFEYADHVFRYDRYGLTPLEESS
jgi:hypothetical protein